MSDKIPKIKGIVRSDTQELERFQNEVLRPILKHLHPILIQNFEFQLEKRKIKMESLSSEMLEKHINAMLSKDIAYKNFQLGMVVGHLKMEEMIVYEKDTGEYNRRILQMLKKRLKDTYLK